MHKKIKYFLPLLSIGILLLQKPFSKTIFSLSDLDTYYLNERRSLYPNPVIGRIFENKATQVIYQFKKNFFNGLDINLYFFATHPRERPEVSEVERFNWLFLPFFLSGIFYQLRKRIFWMVSYFFITLTSISFFGSIDNYIFLLYPFFILTIFLGIYNFLKKSEKSV